MKTKIYGCSDDLVELDGAIYDEIDCYSTAEEGLTIECSDGTMGVIRYFGDWTIEIDEKGFLFDKVVKCSDETLHTDEDAKGCSAYSDVLIMKDGLDWIKINNKTYKD